MAQFEWVHAAWLALAIVLEIVANVFLKFSDGFRRKIFGLLSLAAVLAAFSALSQAVKGIDLSVAYALWGGFGIAATLAAGWILFGHRYATSEANRCHPARYRTDVTSPTFAPSQSLHSFDDCTTYRDDLQGSLPESLYDLPLLMRR